MDKIRLKEVPRLDVREMTGAQFIELMAPHGVPDRRFKDGGDFELAPSGKDSTISERDTHCIVLELHDHVVGYAELKLRKHDGYVEISSICVQRGLKGLRRSPDKSESDLRFAEELVRGVVRFAKANRVPLEMPELSFLPQGEARLKHLIERVAKGEKVRVLR